MTNSVFPSSTRAFMKGHSLLWLNAKKKKKKKKQDMVSTRVVHVRNKLFHVWLILKSATKVNEFRCSPLKGAVTRRGSGNLKTSFQLFGFTSADLQLLLLLLFFLLSSSHHHYVPNEHTTVLQIIIIIIIIITFLTNTLLTYRLSTSSSSSSSSRS